MTNNYLSAAAASSSASSAAAINDSSFDEEEVSSDLVDHSGNKDNETLTDKEADVNDDNDDDVDLESIFFTKPGTSRTERPGPLGQQQWRTTASVSSSEQASVLSSMCGTLWRRAAFCPTRAVQSTCFGHSIF